MYDLNIYVNVIKYTCSIFILLNVEFSSLDYTTNNFSEDTEVEEISKQCNRDYFDFDMDLEVSI
jgi:hypothetical protein